MDRLRRLLPFVKPLLILALFALALRALQDTLSHYRYHDVVAYVSSLRADQIILAAVLTLLGYLVMTGYDTLAFRYIRHPLPYRKIALASFIGYAFNNNVGLSGLVGVEFRDEICLILPERDVAVRAPRAAVEHHNRGLAGAGGGQRDCLPMSV